MIKRFFHNLIKRLIGRKRCKEIALDLWYEFVRDYKNDMRMDVFRKFLSGTDCPVCNGTGKEILQLGGDFIVNCHKCKPLRMPDDELMEKAPELLMKYSPDNDELIKHKRSNKTTTYLLRKI